ncbi:MAG: twin-arginine translocation signal domain-containing protein, partial [Gammaproteobacteria bacterium]|nr:twin-arginine translocation signal domain-containing protein [Gammaproteobacteria bacterium]
MTDALSRRNFIKASGIALGSTALPVTPTVAIAATAKALASNPPDVTRQLASWIVASEWGDIPERTRYEAVRS